MEHAWIPNERYDNVHTRQQIATPCSPPFRSEGLSRVAVIRRLDHVIVAVEDRSDWIPVIQRVLALEPGRMLEGAGQGSSGFSNAEFAIGDGFLGMVTPAGDTSQLRRFVRKFGDGFYGMSIDVGDIGQAAMAFDKHGVDYRRVEGGDTVYAGPRQTHGVVYQVIDGMLLGQGTNPRYRGLARLTIAVHDLESAIRDYETIFDLTDQDSMQDDPPGTKGRALRLSGSDLGQVIALVAPTRPESALAEHLRVRGEGMYSFAIAVSDFDGELGRLERLGIATQKSAGGVLIDPEELRGLRVELLSVP
jgi:4-hydroxyphenylpyruvate dioxygenase-like putative hemolysin